MPKAKRTYEKPLYIDMDFEEALKRFGTTDAKELPDNIKLSRKRRRPKSAKKPQVPVKK
jgi:hypothetical protein